MGMRAVISGVCGVYALAILLGGPAFWEMYMKAALWTPWDPTKQLMSTAIALFLVAYAAVTVSAPLMHTVQIAVWAYFLVFALYYLSSCSLLFQVSNVGCAVGVLAGLAMNK